MKLAPPYKPPTINRLSRPDVFVLASIDAGTWQILNKRYGPGDARLVVAKVRQIGADEVWVEWSGQTTLPTTYRTPLEVLDSATRQPPRPSAPSRPAALAHFPLAHPRASGTRWQSAPE
jgi:hypothetical protein